MYSSSNFYYYAQFRLCLNLSQMFIIVSIIIQTQLCFPAFFKSAYFIEFVEGFFKFGML